MGSQDEPMESQGVLLVTHGAMDPGLWGPSGQGASGTLQETLTPAPISQ